MAKFIAYEKLSKKEQKKLNAEKRKTWGELKPITKVKPSAKLYNRKKKQDLTSYSKLNPVFVLRYIVIHIIEVLKNLFFIILMAVINTIRRI